MRDFLPEQAKKKQFIEDFLRRIFERYGYEPIQTPIVEEFELLSAKGSGGEAIKEEIYYFKDKSDRELGLRYDLTVPLARIVASNPAMLKPFKRYCIGQVYRYDKPQARRYREFTQADVDIVGAKSVLADFESIQIAIDVMRGLGLDFAIKINNRQVLEELAKKCGVPDDKIKECFRAIDKMDKIGKNEVVKELKAKGIPEKIMHEIETNSFERVKDIIGETEGMKNLERLLELSKESNYKEVIFDISLARGLEYYTGNVFEISIRDGPSVGGGGRYDKLIEVYGGLPTPAVGISFGVDRLYDALASTLTIEQEADIFVAAFSEKDENALLSFSSSLRKIGVGVEIDLIGRNIRKNVEYASKKGLRFFAVIGENETKSGKIKIKGLKNNVEKEFEIKDLKGIAEFIKNEK
jgi:histidyl-tRNA synthetase